MPPVPDALPASADAQRTIDFRRSLRASRARRGLAVRRRRMLRGRGAAVAMAAGLAAVSGGAFAEQRIAQPNPPAVTNAAIVAAQRALGVVPDGIVGPMTRAATRRFQRAHGLAVDGVLGGHTLMALGVNLGAAGFAREAMVGTDEAAGSMLARIAACESNDDPTAVSASGVYRGKYQFSEATWRAMGGTGDPAEAPEMVQDQLAAALLARAGTRPWPRCA